MSRLGGIQAPSERIIVKFDSTGHRIWATYYGGTGDDEGFSITLNNNDDIFITGSTSSRNFPVMNAGGNSFYQGAYSGGTSDAFLLKFDNSGERKWAI